MIIVVPSEITPGEHRVALTPDSAARLVKSGHEVRIEAGAGTRAGFPDSSYVAAGVTIAPRDTVYDGAALVCRVQPPTPGDVALMPPGSALLALLAPARNAPLLALLADLQVTALALELVPRLSRAQSMDVLSSQATVAGYKAVLLGAAALPRFLPMLTTAAGTVSPARVFVIGAGVAGLQAIATARRLGGVVSAFDVRPAAREQVLSLGATFIAAELVESEAETSGGYARAQSGDAATRTREALAAHLPLVDLVVTTAQIPGRKAPMLITAEMVASMKPGSVIVDVAAESGGNCALTVAGETTTTSAVTILGPRDLAASVPYHASQMFAKNVVSLVTHLSPGTELVIDATDEITGPMLVTHDGAVRHLRPA
jgi:NAD(P) transhydrogenase subunit alpha